MVVDDDGTATLSVFSGEVELYNEQGNVRVGPREQARAEKGRAPVKLTLQVSRERIQWVSAATIEESRHPNETLAQAYERVKAARAARMTSFCWAISRSTAAIWAPPAAHSLAARSASRVTSVSMSRSRVWPRFPMTRPQPARIWLPRSPSAAIPSMRDRPR